MRATALALFLVALAGCTRTGVRASFDARDLNSALDRVLAWHRQNAPALAASLQPGLSRSQIEQLAHKRNVVLPEEVYALYGWRNGMRDRKPFFDVYQLVPLAEALEASDMLHAALPTDNYRLPIFQSIFSDDGYDIVCPRKPQAQAAVEFFVDGSPSPGMDNLTAFAQSLAVSFERGVFAPDGHGELDTNRPAFERALLDFRPSRKADVETVLRDQALSLPMKRQMQAYDDLIRTENPRAEAFIAQTMDYWLSEPDSRFRGLNELAWLNTPGAFALLQRAARHPNMEVRRAAFEVLAWQAKWDGRQLEPEVETAALADLLNPKPQLCERRELARVLRWSPDKRPVFTLKLVFGWLDLSDNACARDTRIAIVQALGQLGDRSAVPLLLNHLKGETDPGTRIVLMAALADLGNAEGERQLRARLRASDANVLWNLGEHGESVSERRIARELLRESKRGN